MHNIEESCKIIRFIPIENMPEIEAEFLEEYFDVVSVNYTDDGKEEYVCYATTNFSIDEFRSEITRRALNFPPYTEEIVKSKNWLADNMIKFSPFEIGSFMIYGIHEPSCPQTNKIPVQVYAATAFGSSHHTTQMCLQGITDLYPHIPTPHKILDMGTGSGILSIAACKLWQKQPQIIAADIDEEAVDVTANNAITNDVENNFNVLQSDGYKNDTILKTAPYDLIFANILANPLKEMCQSAYNALQSGGCYLISGFIDNQENDIIQHHISVGFKVLHTYHSENWCAALLKKE